MGSVRMKKAAALAVAMLLIFIGAKQLLQWFSGGGIWVNFKSRGEPNNFVSITYADHALNLTATLTLDVLLVVTGCVAIMGIFRKTGRWFE